SSDLSTEPATNSMSLSARTLAVPCAVETVSVQLDPFQSSMVRLDLCPRYLSLASTSRTVLLSSGTLKRSGSATGASVLCASCAIAAAVSTRSNRQISSNVTSERLLDHGTEARRNGCVFDDHASVKLVFLPTNCAFR